METQQKATDPFAEMEANGNIAEKDKRNPKQKLHWSEKCENSNKETEIIENMIYNVVI